MTIWVVFWSYDWEEGSKVFTDEEEANKFVLALFDIDDRDDLTEAYMGGKWKAFGMHEHTVEVTNAVA